MYYLTNLNLKISTIFKKILPGLEKQFLNLYMEKSFNINNKNDLLEERIIMKYLITVLF